MNNVSEKMINFVKKKFHVMLRRLGQHLLKIRTYLGILLSGNLVETKFPVFWDFPMCPILLLALIRIIIKYFQVP